MSPVSPGEPVNLAALHVHNGGMVKDMVEQAYGYAFILAAHAAARTAGVESSVLEMKDVS